MKLLLSKRHQGFTLIEVMLVIVLIGLMVSVVQISFSSNKPEQLLEQSSAKFAGVFEIAAEYGLLNNIELGLFIDENTYQFLGYDGTRWVPIADNPLFEVVDLPEEVEIDLQLDDLPVETSALADYSALYAEEDGLSEEEDDKKIIPQVYILSGGDITPFKLTFSLAEFVFELDSDISYQVTGSYSTPLTIEGPIVNERSR